MIERSLPRNVLLGVSGSIAAYKSAMLVRELVKAGAHVQVVMTRSAHDFVTPLTLATLSGSPVLTELIDRAGEGTWNDHVHLARWADVILIAPASANTLGKMAHGLCDNLLLATFLSATCPVYVAPAMDLEMYRDTSTRSNLDLLMHRGVRTIGPDRGDLASGLTGEGRMTEPQAIVDRLIADLMGNSPLRGRSILVTAGPTQEAIDPVRYIGNRSTGKMGFAVALEAAQRGALVTLVAGPVALQLEHPGITRVDVTSAAEMASACERYFGTSDIVVMSAAVADLRPTKPADQKIKKVNAELTLALEPTTDILEGMGRNKRPGQRIVGFALETTNELAHATDKLHRKHLDLLVLNSLQDKGAGFGHDTNKVTLLSPGTDPQELPLMSKAAVACAILDRLEQIL